MKNVLTTCMALMLVVAMNGEGLSPLRVKGNQLVDKNGQRVLLHGVMDTPNPYFNSYGPRLHG